MLNLQHVAGRQADVAGDARFLHGLAEVAADVVGIEAVAVQRRAPSRCARRRPSRCRRSAPGSSSAGSPPLAFSLAAKKAGISLPVTIFDFLASAMFTALEFGIADTDMSGLSQLPEFGALLCALPDVVAVHVAHEDDVDLAEPRIVRAGDRAARIVEDARAVRVLEDQRAILRAELAVDAAERRHLHGLGQRRKSSVRRRWRPGLRSRSNDSWKLHPLFCKELTYHRRAIGGNGRCVQAMASSHSNSPSALAIVATGVPRSRS